MSLKAVKNGDDFHTEYRKVLIAGIHKLEKELESARQAYRDYRKKYPKEKNNVAKGRK